MSPARKCPTGCGGVLRPEATFRDAPSIVVDTCNTCGESFVDCQMVCTPEDYYRFKAREAK